MVRKDRGTPVRSLADRLGGVGGGGPAGATGSAEAPDRVPLSVRWWMLESSVRLIHGPGVVEYGKDELVVVCLVRDGEPYVRTFIEHYRSLGVRHIVFLDNASEDYTVRLAQEHEGVTILQTPLPYKKYKYLMKQYLIRHFGKDRWTLCVDIDELFDYPYSEVVDLPSFLRYLNRHSYTAVLAHMLDMFPEGPMEEASGSFKEAHRFYDISTLGRGNHGKVNNVFSDPEIRNLVGGIRRAIFGVDAHLSKYPLILYDGKVRPMDGSSHRANDAYVADLACVLYHYKFLESFREQTAKAVREGNYYAGSSQYKQYQEVLEKTPNLNLQRNTARELGSTEELVENGFLIVSNSYKNWAEAEEERHVEYALHQDPRELSRFFYKTRAERSAKSGRILELEHQLRVRTQTNHQLRSQIRELEAKLADGEHERLAARARHLEQQLEAVRNSRTWKVLRTMGLIKSRALRLLRREN